MNGYIHTHVWQDCEVSCEDCGSHPGVWCEECDEQLDLIFNDDPRWEEA